jgi:predicted GIY-YIG superfamily endonuclease
MIYVLELANGKYYVGYSLLYKHRIEKHFAGEGSSWTRLHKPVKVLEVVDGDKDTEREVTLRYMREYGWENVRGAGYTAVNIHKPNLL